MNDIFGLEISTCADLNEVTHINIFIGSYKTTPSTT